LPPARSGRHADLRSAYSSCMPENQMRENATPATEQLLLLVTSVLWVGKLVFCKDLRIQDLGILRKALKIAGRMKKVSNPELRIVMKPLSV